MKKQKDRTLFPELSMSVAGLVLIYVAMFVPSVDLAFFLFMSGIGMVTVGLILLGLGLRKMSHIQETRAVKASDVITVKLLEDQYGIVWVWIMALFTLVFLGVAYFVAAQIVYTVIDVTTTSFNLPIQGRNSMNIYVTLFQWFLPIVAIGVVWWALVSSMRREDVYVPG